MDQTLDTVRRLAAIACCLVICAIGAPAQTLYRLAPLEATPEDRHVQVKAQVTHPGSDAVGGYGAVTLQCFNPDQRPRSIRATLRNARESDRKVHVHLDLSLAAGERTTRRLPAPCCGEDLLLELAIEGTDRVRVSLDSMNAHSMPGPRGGASPAALAISDRGDFASLCATYIRHVRVAASASGGAGASVWSSAIGRSATRGRSMAGGPAAAPTVDLTEPMQRSIEDLPDDWRLLSGFDRIYVDGRARVERDVQSMLVRWLRGGGAMFVSGGGLLASGELRDVLAATSRNDRFVCGLGRLGATDEPLASSPSLATLPDEFLGWAVPHGGQSQFHGSTASVGPAWRDWLAVDNVPGIVGMRADLFFGLICGFVLLVGPLNHLVLARHRRPWLSLVFVPVLGFGTAALILLLSLLQEGITARCVRRTFSMLDQRQHDVVTLETRSIFVGVSPPSIDWTRHTLLQPVSITDPDDVAPPAFRLDVGNGRLGGELLRSRSPTGFVMIAQVPCRERVRVDFRSSPPRYELSGALRLADVDAALVLRDPRGSFWIVDPNDRTALRRVEEATAGRALLDRFQQLAHADQRVEYPVSWVEERTRGLAPGEYVGEFVVGLPSESIQGLDAEEAAGVHVIYGKLDDRDATY